MTPSKQQLCVIATELGADVPFFLEYSTAIGKEIGDELTSAPAPFPFEVVIATPKVYLGTAQMYRAITKFDSLK